MMPRQLVIQLARFGDIIQTGRLVRSLVRMGETHLCVDRSLVEMAQLIYPDCTIHGIAAHSGSYADVLIHNQNAFGILGECRFDAVYNLNFAPINRALATLFSPETVRGYRVMRGQELRERWFRLAFRWMRSRRPAPINLMDFWGMLAPKPMPPADVHPVATPGGRGLGVVLAGQDARRSLPPPILAQVVRAVFERLGGPAVFLLGSTNERAAGRRLMEALPRQVLGKTVNLAGRTGWRALADAVQGLDALLSPDTGTMHLASFLGVPVLATFLSSAWAWETGPYGLGHRVWQASPVCAPCVEASPCTGDMECLMPFSTPAFLNTLASRPHSLRHSPPDLLALDADFDDFGLIWNASTEDGMPRDPAVVARQKMLRAQLAAYHGLFLDTSDVLPDAVPDVYTESDWMLPDLRRTPFSCDLNPAPENRIRS